MALEMIRAYNAGSRAAAYSFGIGACPFAIGTVLAKEWLAGYREAYANG